MKIEVPGSGVVIVSGLSDDPLSTSSVGHLYAVDSATQASDRDLARPRLVRRVGPGSLPLVSRRADPPIASPHGINLEERADGAYDLYVVNHGGREGVEVFRLDLRDGIDLTWTGCVTMPRGTFANGVAPLPGGDGLVVTNFFDPTKSDPFSQIFSDEPSGNLMRWEPDRAGPSSRTPTSPGRTGSS